MNGLINTQELIKVMIRTREGIIFDDKVKGLSSYNEKGVFDILPQHANFISLITNTIILHQKNDIDQLIPITSGILRVLEDEIKIYLDVKEDHNAS